MNEEQEPSQSSSPDIPEPSPDPLVSYGRTNYLGIILVVFLAETGTLFLPHQEPSPIRLGLAVGLFAAAWYGFDWAIFLLALGFATGVLLAALATVLAIIAGAELTFFLSLTVGVAYAAIVVALFRSRSLNAFFKFQSQQRRANAADRSEDPDRVDPFREPMLPQSADEPIDGTDHRLVTVASYNFPVRAGAKMLLLEREGVRAFLADANLVEMCWLLAGAVGGAKIQVAESDADRAMQILEEYRAAKSLVALPEEPAVFDCQQCGQDLMLPADRRGRVETCPHCGCYVDVPE